MALSLFVIAQQKATANRNISSSQFNSLRLCSQPITFQFPLTLSPVSPSISSVKQHQQLPRFPAAHLPTASSIVAAPAMRDYNHLLPTSTSFGKSRYHFSFVVCEIAMLLESKL
ncbi:unnamed protein product [Vicia faba]|uniref:Uncharacterized protein n=1 Tax=Vicia faba TaxID=3906 RepID=A0AAV0YMM0_VICFA|nr:unnamed protein product [Vicia faba]